MAYTPPVDGVSNWDVPLNQALSDIHDTALAAQADADTLAAGGGAGVVTEETSTSTAYTDLATAGPAVSVTLTEARTVIVFVQANVFQASTTDDCFMSFEATGATVLAADDDRAMRHNGSGTTEAYSAFAVVACNAGTTTFTAKHRVLGGTGSWGGRSIAAVVT